MYNNPYLQNQYNRYQPMEYMQQPVQYQQPQVILPKQNNLCGKLIENEEIAKTIESPLDGSTMYLPLLNGSKIIAKQLSPNGMTKTTIYEKINDSEPETNQITLDDIRNDISNIKMENNDDIREDLKEIIRQLKELKAKK